MNLVQLRSEKKSRPVSCRKKLYCKCVFRVLNKKVYKSRTFLDLHSGAFRCSAVKVGGREDEDGGATKKRRRVCLMLQ